MDMRHMSFAMTTPQMYARTKTVTRRFGWWTLQPGDRLWAVEKAQGLAKGEKVKKIAAIEVVSTRREQPIWLISHRHQLAGGPYVDSAARLAELEKEGFPRDTPLVGTCCQFCDFVDLLCGPRRRTEPVNRIEFRFLEDQT